MMRKAYRFILIFLLFMNFLFLPVVSASEEQPTLGELKAQYQAKLDEKARNDAQTEAARQEIAQKEAAIKEVEKEISASEAELERIQEEIEVSNEEILRLKSEVEKVLLYLQQTQGDNAYVEYVSGASSMTDLMMRLAVVEQITDAAQTSMKNLEEEIKKNEQLKVDEQNKKAELERKAENYKAVVAARYNDIASYDKYGLDIDTQIKTLKTKLDSAKQMCAAYAPDKGDAAIVSVDCVKPAEGGYIANGAWLKPLNYGVITSEVGYRWGSYHNALDIGGNAEGTPVYAAAAGVVSGMVYKYSCGGNMLYIDVVVNGVAYTTYYYHLLRFNVSLGQTVTQNTIIGYVGGGSSTSSLYGGYDNCTTGAHLHFGVAKGFYNGYSVSRSNVITPPGFPNSYGWRFNSRYQMYS